MCCLLPLLYELFRKCHKKEKSEQDKLQELFTLEEHIDEKIIDIINDIHKWKNSLRKFPLRKHYEK